MRLQAPVMFLGGLCLLLAGVAFAASSPVTFEEVTKCRSDYAQKLQELKRDGETTKTNLLACYLKTLMALRQAAIQKGDLDALQAVDDETKRYEKQKMLPPVTQTPATPELAKAVRLCREELERTEMEGARKIRDFTDQYLNFLDKQKKQAMKTDKTGKFELARAYDDELKAARETPDYQAAKFTIADKSAAEPVKSAPPPDPAPPASDANKTAPAVTNNIPQPVLAQTKNGPNGEKIQPRVDPEGLYDAAHIFEGAPPGTLGTASSYRRLAAIDTGKAPLTGSVGLELEGWLDGENAKYQLRFKLRIKSTGATFTNLKVLAQYFAKSSNNGLMQEGRTQFALIPLLGAKGITCEMKPAELPFASNYHARSGTMVEDREGSFAGTIVSVFTSDDKLVGQVSVPGTLRDRCKTAFELPNAWLEHIGGEAAAAAGGAPPSRWRRRHPPVDN